jgi:hypothetical protein
MRTKATRYVNFRNLSGDLERFRRSSSLMLAAHRFYVTLGQAAA